MKKKVIQAAFAALLLTALSGCGRSNSAAELAPTAAPISTAAPSETQAETGGQDGERFEEFIILEGMEETVRYEHVRDDKIGFELDYDYERFIRQSGSEYERFVSVYDLPDAPENYLELRYSAEDADTVCASVSAALAKDYEIITESVQLDRAGRCIRIDASNAKGNGGTPELLQTVYIVPAADGCRVAAAHCTFESAEGFGRRFAYMINTLAVIDRQGERRLSDEQALSAVKRYCYANNPELAGIVNAGEYPVYWELASSDAQETVVLFRSYTGAQVRYYVNPVSGETYVTEFVPGITAEEMRTDERFNVWDYTASIAGTWQTASIGFMADGTMAPEYDVRFTAADIVYGHMRDGVFVFDHADPIVRLEKTAAGGFRVQAEGANGVRYTYQTCEGDENVLEYYETWDENAFPETYSGGASLSRCG